MSSDNNHDAELFATVNVRGTGEIEAVPDEAHLSVVISEEARSRDAALDAVTERMTKVEALLDELDIGQGDRTSTVRVGENRERDGNRWLSKGFRATTRLELRIHDAEVLGRLIAGLVDHGDAEVVGPRWVVTHEHPARIEACNLAAANARTKAEAYAAGVGSKLGPAVQVTEPGLKPPPVQQPAFAAGEAAPPGAGYPGAASPGGGGVSTPELLLHPGTRQIPAAVEVVFRLMNESTDAS